MVIYKIEGTGVTYFKRIVCNGKLVAIAEQLTDKRWIVNDLNDRRMTDQSFESAIEVRNWVKENFDSTT